MEGFLVIFSLCILSGQAVPFSRIANGIVPTEDYANDIWLIFLQGHNYFSVLNIIAVSTSDFIVGDVGTVTGYGFVSEDTIGIASLNPMSGNQTVAHTCVFEDFEAAESHFCALDRTVAQSIVCPGDNGKYHS